MSVSIVLHLERLVPDRCAGPASLVPALKVEHYLVGDDLRLLHKVGVLVEDDQLRVLALATDEPVVVALSQSRLLLESLKSVQVHLEEFIDVHRLSFVGLTSVARVVLVVVDLVVLTIVLDLAAWRKTRVLGLTHFRFKLLMTFLMTSIQMAAI